MVKHMKKSKKPRQSPIRITKSYGIHRCGGGFTGRIIEVRRSECILRFCDFCGAEISKKAIYV